jgi:molybdopterin-guanine dinucleotide biosynthesis protein A
MAGGKSSRMGTDKSFIKLSGKPMVEHVLEKVRDLGDELIIISNRPNQYKHLAIPTYADLIPDKGPLGGLYTALYRSSRPSVLIVACDMPWLNRRLLNYMISIRMQADAIVPRWTDHPEPLHAIYSKDCLTAIEGRLFGGELKMVSFYDDIKVHYIEKTKIAHFDPDGRSFANINTPKDLQRASDDDGLSQ